MIFCTIGTQAPFDRLIKIVDEIAAEMDEDIVAQTFGGSYKVKNIKTVDFLPPDELQQYFDKARVIVAHAGMGTIISAMRLQKPLVVFPRIAKLGEHRNEHQLATAQKMQEFGYVYVARDAEELRALLKNPDLKSLHELGEFASRTMIDELCRVIG